MTDGIFLIKEQALSVLRSTPYQSEDLLQEALARFPEVLAGGTTSSEDQSTALMLVRREMGVPSQDGAPARWSVDHLFIDGHGVPVLVEVKRSTDTRIRREVVGQMLDYAANASRYWPIADLRIAFDTEARQAGMTGDERLRSEVPGVDPEAFWDTIARNLRAGKIRLVFVADVLPPELVRIIEFLNEQMQTAEVLGVEVPQYVDDAGHQVLVPRLVGRTSAAIESKVVGSGGHAWDESSLLQLAEESHGPVLGAVFRRLLEHVHGQGGRFGWGKGASPGVSGWYRVGDGDSPVWTANAGTTPGSRPSIYFYFPMLRERLSPPWFEAFVGILSNIERYRPKLEAASRKGWESTYPSTDLLEIARSPEESQRLFEAIELVTSG